MRRLARNGIVGSAIAGAGRSRGTDADPSSLVRGFSELLKRNGVQESANARGACLPRLGPKLDMMSLAKRGAETRMRELLEEL